MTQHTHVFGSFEMLRIAQQIEEEIVMLAANSKKGEHNTTIVRLSQLVAHIREGIAIYEAKTQEELKAICQAEMPGRCPW